MIITLETLARFCSEDERLSYSTPFSSDKFTYATDARIIIRVDRVETVPSDDRVGSYNEAIEKAFAAAAAWIAVPGELEIPPAPEEKPCQECGGNFPPECQECGGSGVVEWVYTGLDGKTYYYDAECPVCFGTGGSCSRCGGTGKEELPFETMQVGNCTLNPKYLRLIALLPDAEISPNGPDQPAAISFFRGVGAVMPLRD